MSSFVVFNRVAKAFPQGELLDTSGNIFNLFMEFPTTDGRMASVQIWDEGVNFYHIDGEVLSNKQFMGIVDWGAGDTGYTEDDYERYVDNVETIFSFDGTDDNGDMHRESYPNEFFDNNTMIQIGKAWGKFNQEMHKAFRGA